MTRTATNGFDANWQVRANAGLSAALDRRFEIEGPGSRPGLILAVLHGDQLLHLKGYGCANMEFGIPWAPDVRYMFYSLTKSMTAWVMLELEAKGTLSLDDEIQRHLPDFPRYRDPITIRHLLTHTSGLWQDEALVELLGLPALHEPISVDSLYELVRRQPTLPYAPGSHHAYSDTAMRMAARIIETASGMTFGAALRTFLFEPAGMHTARSHEWECERLPLQALPYLVEGNAGSDRRATMPQVAVRSSGDGGTSGSMLDLIAYAQFLRQHTNDGGRRIEGLTVTDGTVADPARYYRRCINVLPYRRWEICTHAGLFGKRMTYVPAIDAWVLVMRNALQQGEANSFSDTAFVLDSMIEQVDAAKTAHERSRALDLPYLTAPCMEIDPAHGRVMAGRYLEPVSGYPLEISFENDTLSYRFFGEQGALVRLRKNAGPVEHYASYLGTAFEIGYDRVSSELRLCHADWSSPRPLSRVRADTRLAAEVQVACVGSYLATAFGSIYHLQLDSSGALTLMIGSHTAASMTLLLEHFAHDVFVADVDASASDQFTSVLVRFHRRHNVVVGATLDTDNVRGLELVRLLAPVGIPGVA